MSDDGKEIEEQDGELDLKSVPSNGSEKSASPSPSHSKDGSLQSRSGSRSQSRSKSKSKSRSRSKSKSRTRSLRGSRRYRSRSRPYHHRSRSRSHSHSPMSGRRRHVGNRANPEPNTCLGVFGLSLYTTERDLREVFSKYGPLNNVIIVYDQQSRRSRGFGFVYFQNSEDSREAKDRANGMELDGRRIRVDFSITKRAHTPTPGIYMGRLTSTSSGAVGRLIWLRCSETCPVFSSGSSSRRGSWDYDRGYESSYDRGYSRYDDREYRSYRRRCQSPLYYSRSYRSRSRSQSPRHY
ncbi:LOW QUALITY PROTEIN: transformer-2 protein homolog beta-like [Synchiropus picturatus]